MPTYEYRCANGHDFEQFQRMTEPPIEKCPVCGGAAERLLSAGAGLLFKGSGFYITDYRSDSYKKAAKADSGSGEGGQSSEKSGKSEKSEKSESKADKPSGKSEQASGSSGEKTPGKSGGEGSAT
jgi:putative FmdB family regulatory protein